jgi:ATP-GRASP peptide maturase of grasp-with-spasm system
MIVIISQNAAEHTTNFVCDWLHAKKIAYRRINGVDAYFEIDYVIGQNKSCSEDEILNKEKNVFWYRRWVPQEYFFVKSDVSTIVAFNRQFYEYIRGEARVIKDYFLSQIDYSFLLTDFNKTQLNKLDILNKAAISGLKVPETIVTAQKDVLLNFTSKHNKVIVKSLSDSGLFVYRNKFYITFTVVLDESILEKIPDTFFPSLIQRGIEKKYEIRTFYLDGKCYSMAIFSQSNKQTASDFRNYDEKKPNRYVPYKLPGDIEIKIDHLMKTIGLNNGSLDFIKAVNGEYFFLEINPVGQFGMTSEPCNYFLEEKVAEWLTGKDKNKMQ